MTYAKKMIVPVLCVLLGCAGGAAVGNVTAQTWPEPANAQRWQQECVSGSRAAYNSNDLLRARGESGWELVGAVSAVGDGHTTFCFKRPAP